MLKLVGTDGKRFYSWPLEPGDYVVGRKPECDFCIPDKTVSRRHAQVTVSEDAGKCTITDLGSHNGTHLNNQTLTGASYVKDGDIIKFGEAEFRISSADDSGVPRRPSSGVQLTADDPQKSVFLSINEALQPLPAKVTDRPDLIPTIFEMAKMLVLPEPQEVILERSLGLISKIIPAERLAVLFVSEEHDEVFPAATLLTGVKDPGAFTLSRTIVNDIMTNKNAILLCDPMEDPRFSAQQSIIMSELKSAIAVPLFDEGRVLGILYADTTNPSHRYDNDHLRVLATFGNIIASRLLNFELMAERQNKQILEAELARASMIQQTLLETNPPEVPGCDYVAFQEQSRSVGGDLYDMKLLPDGRLLFMVADVSGKGMGAALLMSNILASFRILYDAETFDINEAVKKVSLQVLKHSDPGDFATLFLATIEPDTGHVRYINAGHNPPLFIRPDGTLTHLEASGIMIGAFELAEWTESTVEMQDGDLIFIFSDGVTEADPGDEQYGDDRTEKLVTENRGRPAQEIVNCLMDDLNAHMGDAPRSDDITILTLKKVGK